MDPSVALKAIHGRMLSVRLFLSSYQLGDHPELLTSMVGNRGWGWTVMNALDGVNDERRRTDTAKQQESLAAIGLRTEDFDLRRFGPDGIEEAFGDPDFVWVRGGNVFTLRMAMARSGMDQLIVDRLAEDRLVYAGFSAGACVLAPSLAGLEWCDSTDECRSAYGDVRFDGLAVLDRPVVPHLDYPDHPETLLLSDVAAQYDAVGQPYWGLIDGQALVIHGADYHIQT